MVAGVSSNQVLPGFLVIAPPSVLVPAVLSALAVWIQNQKKEQKRTKIPFGVWVGVWLVPGYTTLSVRVWANFNSVS